MSKEIKNQSIRLAAKNVDYSAVLVPVFINANSTDELAEKIALCRLENEQPSATVHFISLFAAFVEVYFKVGE